VKYYVIIPLLIIISVGGAFISTVEAGSYPRPSIVPTSWQLQFEFQSPRCISLRLPGEKKSRTYWYMLYTVTNRTGADRIFVPEFILYTDTGKVYRAGKHVPSEVFHAIQSRHNNPLLMSMARITGPLLQGEDNAKDGVAIWTDIDSKARAFDVFIAGLSGERAKIKLPLPTKVTVIGKDGKPIEKLTDTAILSKTLHLQYRLPGEPAGRANIVLKPIKKEWVMR